MLRLYDSFERSRHDESELFWLLMKNNLDYDEYHSFDTASSILLHLKDPDHREVRGLLKYLIDEVNTRSPELKSELIRVLLKHLQHLTRYYPRMYEYQCSKLLYPSCAPRELRQILLDNGGSIERATVINSRELPFLAATLGRIDLMATYIEDGFELKTTNTEYDTALDCAVNGNEGEMVAYLSRFVVNYAAFSKAFCRGRIEMAELIGCTFQYPPAFWTLTFSESAVDLLRRHGVMMEACNMPFAAVKSLFDRGLITSELGNDLLALTTAPETIRLLAERGFNVNNRNGRALIQAANKPYGVAEELIYLKSDINLRDGDGQNALFKAASLGRCVVMRLLLDAGCDVFARDNSQRTALCLAATSGSVLAVKMLLACAGTELVNAKDRVGNTPLHFAARSNNAEIFKLILDAGADPEQMNDQQATPNDIIRLARFVPTMPPFRLWSYSRRQVF